MPFSVALTSLLFEPRVWTAAGPNASRLLDLEVLDLTGAGSEAVDDDVLPFGTFDDEIETK